MTETWYHHISRDPVQVSILKEEAPDERIAYYAAVMDRMDKAAKFLVTQDIIDIVSAPGFMFNIPLLAKAEKLKLPFDPLVVEYEPPNAGGRWFICLRQFIETQRMFSVDVIYKHDKDKTMLLSDAGTTLLVSNEAIDMTSIDDKSGGQAASAALAMAIVGHVTKGIVKNKVAPSEKLNKARAKKGKAAIPEYTTMRIGTVYDRDGKPHMWSGNTTGRKLHWRRAHLRQQPHGPGNSLRKEILVEAMIVNYNPGDEVPELPKRKVKL